jgi:hypothetical protein
MAPQTGSPTAERVLASGRARWGACPIFLRATQTTVYYGGGLAPLASIPRQGGSPTTLSPHFDASVVALNGAFLYGATNRAGANDVLRIAHHGGPTTSVFRSEGPIWDLTAAAEDELYVLEGGGRVHLLKGDRLAWSLDLRTQGGSDLVQLRLGERLEVFGTHGTGTRVWSIDRASSEILDRKDLEIVPYGLVADDDAFYGFRIVGAELLSDLCRIARDGARAKILAREVDGGIPLALHRDRLVYASANGPPGRRFLLQPSAPKAASRLLLAKPGLSVLALDDEGVVWLEMVIDRRRGYYQWQIVVREEG